MTGFILVRLPKLTHLTTSYLQYFPVFVHFLPLQTYSSTLSQISESISIIQNVCESVSIGLICLELLVFDWWVINLRAATEEVFYLMIWHRASEEQTGQKQNSCKFRETYSAISTSSLHLLLEHFCTAFQQNSNTGDEESLSKYDFQLLICFVLKNSCLTSSLNWTSFDFQPVILLVLLVPWLWCLFCTAVETAQEEALL